NIRPKIEIAGFGLFNEACAQLLPIVRMQTEIVIDRIVHEKELAADFFVLFEHQRVKTQLVTPPRCGKAGGTSADDYDIVHRVAQTVSLRSAPLNRKAVPSSSPTLPLRLRWVHE